MVRLESKQGSGDDTALNGIVFKACAQDKWNNQKDIKIHDGKWGHWSSMKMCDYNQFVSGVEWRIESNQGSGDDTSVNGLRILCKKFGNSAATTKTVSDGFWGSW